MMFLCLFLLNFVVAYSFNPVNKPSLYESYKSKIKFNDDLFYDNLKEDCDLIPSNILFFTSVSNNIPSFVYDNFLKMLSEKYDNNILVPKQKDDIKRLANDSPLTVIAHASGTIEALKYAKNKKVKNLVLIDPVDNRLDKISGKKTSSIDNFWDEDEDSLFELKNIEKVLYLYTKKSYKRDEDSSIFGLVLNPLNSFKTLWPSFIPEKLSIKPKDLKTSIVDCENQESLCNNEDSKLALKISNYGLCDILNLEYSNFAHNTICEGSLDRSEENLTNYQKRISLIINLFLKYDYENYRNYLDDLVDFNKIK